MNPINQIILALLLTAVLLLIAPNAVGAEYTVDDDWAGADFDSIYDAVNASEDGDTVLIHAGEYTGPIQVPVSIQIIGNGSDDTTIMLHGAWWGFNFEVGGIDISGLAFTGSEDAEGIRLDRDAKNITISDCTFIGIDDGVYSFSDGLLTIEDCLFANSTTGVFLDGSGTLVQESEFINLSSSAVRLQGDKHILMNSTIADSGRGVWVVGDENIIVMNTITNSTWDSIMFSSDASNCYVLDCEIDGGRQGISMAGVFNEINRTTITGATVTGVFLSTGNSMYNTALTGAGVRISPESSYEHFVIENSTVNGLPLVYKENEQDFTISGGAGQVLLHDCDNATIEDLVLENCSIGIQITFGKGIELFNISVANVSSAILIEYSEDISAMNVSAVNGIEEDLYILQSTDIEIMNGSFMSDSGVFVENSIDVEIQNTSMHTGIHLRGEDEEHFTTHDLANCTVDGRPLLFLNGENGTDASGEHGQVMITNSTNVTYEGFSLNAPLSGVEIFYSSNITLLNGTINGSRYSIYTEGCDDLMIRNVTITNSTYVGIALIYTNWSMIEDCKVVNATSYGLYLYGENLTMKDSSIDYGDGTYWGMVLYGSHIDISNSTMTGDGTGIYASASWCNFSMNIHNDAMNDIGFYGSHNRIENLNITSEYMRWFTVFGNDNSLDGLRVVQTNFSFTLRGDDISVNDAWVGNASGGLILEGNGISITDSSFENSSAVRLVGRNISLVRSEFARGLHLGSIDEVGAKTLVVDDCTIDGSPLIIYSNQADVIVPSSATHVILINCTDTTISDVDVEGIETGIIVFYSTGIEIINSTVTDCSNGILVSYSEDILIQGTTVDGCDEGIFFNVVTDAVIKRNTIKDFFDYGLSLVQSEGVMIYYNDLIFTEHDFDGPADDDMGSEYNTWILNYWHDNDPTDSDKDGIDDDPYEFEYSRYDYQPLVMMVGNYTTLPPVTDSAPEMTIEHPLGSSFNEGHYIQFTGAVSDDRGRIERVEVRIDGGSWENVSNVYRNYTGGYEWSFYVDAGIGRGTHEFEFRAFDGGNYSTIQTRSIKIVKASNPWDVDDEDEFDLPLFVEVVYIVLTIIIFIAIVARLRAKEEKLKGTPPPPEKEKKLQDGRKPPQKKRPVKKPVEPKVKEGVVKEDDKTGAKPGMKFDDLRKGK